MLELSASVLVCVTRDPRLHRLIESLRRQSAPPTSYEIIVVENGSDRFSQVADHGQPAVRYLQLPRSNVAAARQAGLEIAAGRYLLLTDSDCVAAPIWIEELTAALDSGRWSGVGGTIEKYRPTTATQRYGITIVDGQGELNYLRTVLPLPYVVTANAGFVTAALRAVGGFDPTFVSGSDVDVCYQLGLAGHRLGVAPAAVVFHEDRATVRQHFQRFSLYSQYQVRLFRKYRHLTGRRMVINPYPICRLGGALALLPRVVLGLLRRDASLAWTCLLQAVEAIAVWWGDVLGSVRNGVLYV